MLERLRCPTCNKRFSADADRNFAGSSKLDCPNCNLSSTLSQYRLFAEPESVIATLRNRIDKESQITTKHDPQIVENADFKFDADTLKGCGCLTFLTWILGYYVLFQYGCVGPSLQEREIEARRISGEIEAENRKQQLEEGQEVRHRIAADEERRQRAQSDQLAAQQKQQQQELERNQQAAEEKATAQIRRLQAIRNSAPQKTMIQCVTYLIDYNSDLSNRANDARNAWQRATYDGNLSAMRRHYGELQGLLGREFLGYYWDVDDIMRDENKIRKILAESAEFRRKNPK